MPSYEGTIWRPPSEADSLILQATIGCSHNACSFCVSYKSKRFRVRGVEGIRSDLEGVPNILKQNATRVFLADGDALSIDTVELVSILRLLRQHLPSLQRVGLYAYAKNLRNKSVDDLVRLREEGLGIVYFGLESGDDDVLRGMRKGVSAEENIEACLKIKRAGIPLSVTIIIGLAGVEGSTRHAQLTAEALNRIDPEYTGALTLMLPRGTEVYERMSRGDFKPLTPLDTLRELRTLVEGLKLTECVFRTNHASNYLPLRGTLNRDRQAILELLDSAIAGDSRLVLRPEPLRGL